MAKVGLQIYTVRDIAQEDLFGTIQKVAEAGYDGIEFDANLPERADAVQLKSWMGELGMDVIGISVLMPELAPDVLDAYIASAQKTGAEWIAMPWIDADLRQSAEDYRQVAQSLNRAAEQVRKAGLSFVYHIHGYEWQRFEGQTGMDILLDTLDFNLVDMQVDIFWVASAGVEVIPFCKKLFAIGPNTIGSFHIKDAQSMNPLKDIEVGEGILDVPGIVKLGMAHGIEWLIVEQEAFSMPILESVAISQKNLRRMISEAA